MINHTGKVFWRLPTAVENNSNFKYRILTESSEEDIRPETDYIQIDHNNSKVCIAYHIENYKGWYNQDFYDVSDDSTLLLAPSGLIIPESVFDNEHCLKVKFTWKDFPHKVYTNLSARDSLIGLKDFETIYFASGYQKLDIKDEDSSSSFIFKKNSTAPLEKFFQIKNSVDSFLGIIAIKSKIKLNTFIFVENEFNMQNNPGGAYSNGKEFMQLVGVNKGEKISIGLMHTFVHEYLHKIIGYTIKFHRQKSCRDCWFKEGFVDYLAAESLYRAKFWDIHDYKKFYNHRIFNYYAFGMTQYSLSEMYNVWFYNQSNYIAGMLYVNKLDQLLKTDDVRISNLVKFLACFINNNFDYFSPDFFYTELHNKFNKKIIKMEDTIGIDVLLNDTLLDNKLCLKNEIMLVPVYSVDLYNLLKEMKYKGQDIISAQIDEKDNFIFIIKTISRKGDLNEIRLLPKMLKKIIPQYQPC